MRFSCGKAYVRERAFIIINKVINVREFLLLIAIYLVRSTVLYIYIYIYRLLHGVEGPGLILSEG